MNKLKMALAAATVAAMGMAAMADVSFTVAADKKTADFAFDSSSIERKLYLAYGNADGGDTTNGWDACTFVQTVAAGVTALNGVALPAGYGKQYRAMRAFLEKPATARDYVQEGLVALYDGRENAGWGMHDDSATTWRNLKSDNRKTDLSLTGVTVGTDYMTFDKVQSTTTDGILSGNSDITLETSALSNIDTTTLDQEPKNKWFIQVGGLGGFGFFYSAWIVTVNSRENNDLWQCNWLLSNDYSAKVINDGKFHTLSAAISYHEVESDVRVDGATDRKPRDTQYEAGFLATVDNPDWKFYVGSTVISNQIRSLRVYSRKLTAEETAANAAVDVSRFEGGPVPLESSATKMLETSLEITDIKKVDGTPVSIEIAYSATNIPRKVCIAWGKTDAGDVLADWENKSVLTNAAANSVAMTVLLPPEIGAEIARRGFRVFLGYTTARDYVQEDLVVLYDGLENAGWGTSHDPSPATWRNLASNDRDTDLPLTGVAVGADYMTFNQVERKTAGDVLSGNTNITVEASACSSAAGEKVDAQRWLVAMEGLGGLGYFYNDYMVTCNCRTGNDIYWRSWLLSNDSSVRVIGDGKFHTLSAAICYHEVNAEVRVDGALGVLPFGTFENLMGPGGTTRALVVGSADLNGQIRSVRVYSRRLTAEETAANAAVDAARFEGGYPFNTEATDFTRVNGGLFIVIQ